MRFTDNALLVLPGYYADRSKRLPLLWVMLLRLSQASK